MSPSHARIHIQPNHQLPKTDNLTCFCNEHIFDCLIRILDDAPPKSMIGILIAKSSVSNYT